MNDRRPADGMNRIEAWWGRVRHKKTAYVLILLTVAVGIEATATLAYYGAQTLIKGIPMELYAYRFPVMRLFVRNPVTEQTTAEYVGDYGVSTLAARRWHVADPILGWRLGKNVGITRAIDLMDDIQDPAYRKMTWRFTNGQGFASAGRLEFNVEPTKAPGSFRIIVLGGSTVEGHGAETPLDNLPSRLDAILAALPPPAGHDRYEVINAGVGGYTSGEEYLYLVTELVRLAPDLVIVYDGWNDFGKTESLPEEEQSGPSELRTGLHETLARRLNAGYTPWGALVQAVTAATNEARETLLGLVSVHVLKVGVSRLLPAPSTPTAIPPSSNPSVDIATALLAHRHNFERMTLTARQFGFAIAMFLQPILGVDGKVAAGQEIAFLEHHPDRVLARQTYYRQARPMLAEFARDHGGASVCVKDLSRIFENNPAPLYTDTGHLMGAGNTIVAAGLIAGLQDCGLLPSRP